MARELSALVEKPVSAKVDMGDGDIYKVKFLPHEKGQQEAEELQTELEEAEDKEAAKRKTYETFCRTVKEWDLKEKGEVIPLPVEGLAAAMGGQGVPGTLLTAFLLKAYQDFFTPKLLGSKR
jgi:hypothetical protein